MASNLKLLKALASPKNISPLCTKKEIKSSQNIKVPQTYSTPVHLSSTLRVPETSQNAIKSPITGVSLSPSRISASRKLNWGPEFSPSPQKNFVSSCVKFTEEEGCSVEKIVIDTPRKIALSSYGLNIRKKWIKLGKGSFGTVIHAKYKGDDVAVKVIPKNRFQKSQRSLWNESNALKLSHQNVVRVLQVIATEGEYGLVFMELCKGHNLQMLISDATFIISNICRARYALDIALALHHCHSNKILHLDVKPSNIILCMPDNYCKLCDFGSSLVLGKEECITVSPNINTVIYTDPYILQGKLPSEKSDVYSLGITSWQLTSRENPYEGYTLHTIIYKVGSGKLRPQPIQDDDSDGFSNLYQQCWNQDPDNRPSICDIIQELEKIITNIHSLNECTTKNHDV